MARADIALTPAEIAAFLDEHHLVHVATLRSSGMPHLVTLSYIVLDQRIAFWSYAGAQKIVNLRRDPRLACLVEDGDAPDTVVGVELEGTARLVADRATIQEIGRRVYERTTGVPADDAMLQRMGADKRVGVIVEPERIASWDHRKIKGGYLGRGLSG